MIDIDKMIQERIADMRDLMGRVQTTMVRSSDYKDAYSLCLRCEIEFLEELQEAILWNRQNEESRQLASEIAASKRD